MIDVFNCWITVLTPAYQDGIISGMVKKGYVVGPASQDGNITIASDETAAAVIAIRISRTDENTVSANDIYDDVSAVCHELKVHFYSLIVSLTNDSAWAASNFRLPNVKKKIVEQTIDNYIPSKKILN